MGKRWTELAGCVVGALMCAMGGTVSAQSTEVFVDFVPHTRGERWYLPAEPVPTDIEAIHARLHPTMTWKHADELMAAGEPVRATYWMYMAQIRHRTLLGCRRRSGGSFDREQDSFAALFSDVSQRVNQWAYGDLQLTVDILAKVAADFESLDERFIRGDACAEAGRDQLSGLMALRNTTIIEAATFRTRRSEMGLENRTDGPVMDRGVVDIPGL